MNHEVYEHIQLLVLQNQDDYQFLKKINRLAFGLMMTHEDHE